MDGKHHQPQQLQPGEGAAAAAARDAGGKASTLHRRTRI